MAQTKIKPRQIAGGLDGWIPAEQTWTYASATTITVPSGAASRYQKGDKIKITNNSATKYFYIVGVADTVLTVTGGTDYTVHDSAITNPFFSKIENPQGFPQWFNYSPTWDGSGSMTVTYVGTQEQIFRVQGNSVFVNISGTQLTTGGSASSYVTMTLPVTPAYYRNGGGAFIYDTSYKGGLWFVETNTTTPIRIYKYDTSNFGIGTNRFVSIQAHYKF
jgi:hypothetical protein